MKSTLIALTHVLILLLAMGPSTTLLAADASNGKLNVLVIPGGDLDYGNVGVHGCKDTPLH